MLIKLDVTLLFKKKKAKQSIVQANISLHINKVGLQAIFLKPLSNALRKKDTKHLYGINSSNLWPTCV